MHAAAEPTAAPSDPTTLAPPPPTPDPTTTKAITTAEGLPGKLLRCPCNWRHSYFHALKTQTSHAITHTQFNDKIIITITKEPARNHRFKVSTHAQTESYNQLQCLLIAFL